MNQFMALCEMRKVQISPLAGLDLSVSEMFVLMFEQGEIICIQCCPGKGEESAQVQNKGKDKGNKQPKKQHKHHMLYELILKEYNIFIHSITELDETTDSALILQLDQPDIKTGSRGKS